MEDREPGIQPAEEMAGRHRTRMQLERMGTEEPLSAGADIRFHETAV